MRVVNSFGSHAAFTIRIVSSGTRRNTSDSKDSGKASRLPATQNAKSQ